jgi:hypothetical protein
MGVAARPRVLPPLGTMHRAKRMQLETVSMSDGPADAIVRVSDAPAGKHPKRHTWPGGPPVAPTRAP